jgi:hypothetical protein
VTCPRLRTREGLEVKLDSCARLQHDGRQQRALREGSVAGPSLRFANLLASPYRPAGNVLVGDLE